MTFEETVKGLKTEKGFFTPHIPVYISRAPGRLDLMGGNDDYTGGLVFESTIREATHAAAQLRMDGLVELKNKTAAKTGWRGDVTINLSELSDEEAVRKLANKSSDVRWTAYVLGNIFYLRKKYPDQVLTGIKVYMESTVPLNRGVSSSAAIEVAVMKAAAAAYEIDLYGTELALACQWVENTIAESACGIMDQVAVVMGKQGFIMPLVCQPCNPEPLIKLPEQLKIWGIDSGVSHQIAGVEYEAARAAAFMGYKIICDHLQIAVTRDESSDIQRYTDPIWNGYLANLSCADFYEKFESLLPEQCDQANYLEKHKIHVDPFTTLRENIIYHVWANTKYAVEENQRVRLFSELARGAATNPSQRSFQLMGELMYQSHYAYTECGLGSRATDRIVDLCKKEGIGRGIFGAKITGGGAGGTIVILADKNAGHIIEKIMESYTMEGMGKSYLFEGSSDGADSFGVLTVN